MAVPKTRGGGTMTESAYRSFIKSGLRQKSRRWAPVYQALADAYVGQKKNKLTGRMCKHYECADCGEHFPAKNVAVDHIHPVVPLSGFTTWDDIIGRMFVEKDGLQVLCTDCHYWKTQAERYLAREFKKDDLQRTTFIDKTPEAQFLLIKQTTEKMRAVND